MAAFKFYSMVETMSNCDLHKIIEPVCLQCAHTQHALWLRDVDRPEFLNPPPRPARPEFLQPCGRPKFLHPPPCHTTISAPPPPCQTRISAPPPPPDNNFCTPPPPPRARPEFVHRPRTGKNFILNPVAMPCVSACLCSSSVFRLLVSLFVHLQPVLMVDVC